MKAPEPLFFQRQYKRFLAGPQRQLLWGGRGIGKTSWLLKAHADHAQSTLLRASDLSRGAIEVPSDTQLLLIDGLDIAVRRAGVRDRLLAAINDHLTNDSVRVLATSRVDRGALSRALAELGDYDLFSDWVSHLGAQRINPWIWNWEGRLREKLLSMPHVTLSLANDLIRLSGGHPALLGAGVEALVLSLPGDSGEDLDERVLPGEAALAEAMMDRARHLAGKLINELQSAPSGDAVLDKTRRAARALLADILAGSQPREGASFLARNYLVTSGLVYEDDGDLAIPGPLLREVFAAALAPPTVDLPSAPPATHVRVRRKAEGGQLIWHDAGGHVRRCDLEGKSWAVIERLAQARAGEGDEAVWLSPAAIAKAAATTEAYVRVVVRRVRTQLEASRAALIATDRSQGGYRFVVPVVLDAE